MASTFFVTSLKRCDSGTGRQRGATKDARQRVGAVSASRIKIKICDFSPLLCHESQSWTWASRIHTSSMILSARPLSKRLRISKAGMAVAATGGPEKATGRLAQAAAGTILWELELEADISGFLT